MEVTSLKTRYFRRKENCAAVEWIEMSGAEYLNFVRNPKNKDRFFLNMKNVVFHIQKEPVFVLGITDEVQIFRAAHLDPFYDVAVLLSSEVPRFQDTFLHF